MRLYEIVTGQDVFQKDDVNKYDFDDMIGYTEPTGKKVGPFDIHTTEDNDDFVFLLKDPDSEGFLGELRLVPTKGFHKSTVKFAEEARDKKIAHLLYKMAIVDYGYTIVSDDFQSPGSRKLWGRLADEPGLFVYAWNVGKDEYFQWHPEEDPAEEVYKDEEKIRQLQNRYYDIVRQLRTMEPGTEEATNLENEMKILTQEIDELKSVALADVRLVATAEQGLEESLLEAHEPGQIDDAGIKKIEDHLQKKWAWNRKQAGKTPLYINLTKHFHDRSNDERNREQVTMRELAWLFSKADPFIDNIVQRGPGFEGIFTDRSTNINVVFVIELRDNQSLNMIVKTMMRTPRFHAQGTTRFVVETELDESFASTLTGMAGMLFKDKVYPQAAEYMVKLALRDINKHNQKRKIEWYAHKINDMTPKHDLNIKMLIQVAKEQHPQIFQ